MEGCLCTSLFSTLAVFVCLTGEAHRSVELRQQGLSTLLLSIHLANVHSMLNRMEELLLLNQKNSDFDRSAALCLTEISLSELIPDSTLWLPAFQLFGPDRSTDSLRKRREVETSST